MLSTDASPSFEDKLGIAGGGSFFFFAAAAAIAAIPMGASFCCLSFSFDVDIEVGVGVGVGLVFVSEVVVLGVGMGLVFVSEVGLGDLFFAAAAAMAATNITEE